MKGEIAWLSIMLIFSLLTDSEPIKIFFGSVAALTHLVPRWIEYAVKSYFDKLKEMK